MKKLKSCFKRTLVFPVLPRCGIKFGAWIYPVRNNGPLGFESRYSRTGISNGVNQTLDHRGTAVKSR